MYDNFLDNISKYNTLTQMIFFKFKILTRIVLLQNFVSIKYLL